MGDGKDRKRLDPAKKIKKVVCSVTDSFLSFFWPFYVWGLDLI